MTNEACLGKWGLWIGGSIEVAVKRGVGSRDDALLFVDHDVARIRVCRVSYKLLLGLLRQPERLGDLVLGWETEVLLAEVIVTGRVPVTPLSNEKFNIRGLAFYSDTG